MSKIAGELNAEMMREVKSNKAWRLECEQLRVEINDQARRLRTQGAQCSTTY